MCSVNAQERRSVHSGLMTRAAVWEPVPLGTRWFDDVYAAARAAAQAEPTTMTFTRYRVRPVADRTVVALFTGPSERFLLDTFALLLQEFPKVGGPAFQHAVERLRQRFGDDAVTLLHQAMMLLSEMRLVGRLPRLRVGRGRPAGQDDVFFLGMLSALQQGDSGRGIEAAIALLDTGHVHGAIATARILVRKLGDRGLMLRPIGTQVFDYFAGYPVLTAPSVAVTLAEVGRPRRPVLRLLKSA